MLEVTARSAADVLGIQPNTAALFYRKLRQLIADQLALVEHEVFDGSVELDESYFGGMRKGKRGRGAAGKVIVFGLLKRGGKVYAKVVDNAKASTLIPVIQMANGSARILGVSRCNKLHRLSVRCLVLGNETIPDAAFPRMSYDAE